MATTAADRVFVDSNVLVYAAVSAAPLHAVAALKLTLSRQAGDELWISRQVLREYMATLSRPQTFTQPLPTATIFTDVKTLLATFNVCEDGPLVTDGCCTSSQPSPSPAP